MPGRGVGWGGLITFKRLASILHASFIHHLDNLGTHTSCYGNNIYVYREYVALPAYDVDITLDYT